jgi:hypothetical protein
MAFIKLMYDPNEKEYCFSSFNSKENLGILGMFLTIDMKCQEKFRQLFYDAKCRAIGGNLTYLEKEKHCVIISDIYVEGNYPINIEISNKEFSKILDIWLDTVCKCTPTEVIITYENDQFTIETKE